VRRYGRVCAVTRNGSDCWAWAGVDIGTRTLPTHLQVWGGCDEVGCETGHEMRCGETVRQVFHSQHEPAVGRQ
jgi:hypothetical protein